MAHHYQRYVGGVAIRAAAAFVVGLNRRFVIQDSGHHEARKSGGVGFVIRDDFAYWFIAVAFHHITGAIGIKPGDSHFIFGQGTSFI